MKSQSIAAAAVLVSLLSVGCDEAAPVASEVPIVQFDFMNGPSDLPNVFRRDSIVLFAWPDFTTDLVIVINAPDDPTDLLACGGSTRPEPQPVQTVGELQDVLKQLRLLRDVNIHLYQPVPPGFTRFRDLCETSPFARGTGDLTATDNDRSVTGSGANAFGFRAQGLVDFFGGGSARVSAERQLLIRPDGTCCEVLVSNVRLHSH